MIAEGAAIIDVGGESTRPGAARRRSTKNSRASFPSSSAARESAVFISVDTSKPEVMRAAVRAGADIINDVRALREPVRSTAAPHRAGICLMHMQGEPRTMQDAPHYDDVVAEVAASSRRASRAAATPASIAPPRDRSRLRFRQTRRDNLALLKHLAASSAGSPLAWAVAQVHAREAHRPAVGDRTAGSVALAAIAVLNGARIVRAHDVAATVDAVRVAAAVARERHSMARKYFGTDGVRGKVGEAPDDRGFRAQARERRGARARAAGRHRCLIGKDTRFQATCSSRARSGFVAAGVNVMLIGPLPTPASRISRRKFECNFGVVISASHNRYDDNGIKFFDRDGGKPQTRSRSRSRPSSNAAPSRCRR
jgi:dihydropteroate synthase